MLFIKSTLIFLIGLGFVMYREKIQRFTGDMAFAEKYLGTGGTYRLYLLLGIFMMVFSILYLTGTADVLIDNTIGRIFIGGEK
jgi:hypothetical protein